MTRWLELPDQVYEALHQAAEAAGCSMADWIARQFQPPCQGGKSTLAAQPDQPPIAPIPLQGEENKALGGWPDQPSTSHLPLPPEQKKLPGVQPAPPPSGLTDSEVIDRLRQELRESFENRAIIYWFIYDELRRVLGAEQAEAIMSRAIYRRGLEKGKQLYQRFAPADLAGLRDAFVGRSADQGRLFQPEVLQPDSETLEIKFHGCPLRETWVQMGLADQEVATLCRIAAQVDYGTFEGAGFQFWADTWQPGGQGCCFLHIRPGPSKPSHPASE